MCKLCICDLQIDAVYYIFILYYNFILYDILYFILSLWTAIFDFGGSFKHLKSKLAVHKDNIKFVFWKVVKKKRLNSNALKICLTKIYRGDAKIVTFYDF